MDGSYRTRCQANNIYLIFQLPPRQGRPDIGDAHDLTIAAHRDPPLRGLWLILGVLFLLSLIGTRFACIRDFSVNVAASCFVLAFSLLVVNRAIEASAEARWRDAERVFDTRLRLWATGVAGGLRMAFNLPMPDDLLSTVDEDRATVQRRVVAHANYELRDGAEARPTAFTYDEWEQLSDYLKRSADDAERLILLGGSRLRPEQVEGLLAAAGAAAETLAMTGLFSFVVPAWGWDERLVVLQRRAAALSGEASIRELLRVASTFVGAENHAP